MKTTNTATNLRHFIIYALKIALIIFLFSTMWGKTTNISPMSYPVTPSDTIDKPDTTSALPYPLTPYPDVPLQGTQPSGSIDFKDPPNITEEVIYDPTSNQYVIYKKIGGFNYRTPMSMTFEEYKDYRLENSLQNYWRERSASTGRRGEQGQHDGIIPQIHIGGQLFERIFGSSTIDIRPQGSAELIFGVLSNFRDDPAIDVRRRRTTNFDFQQKIQMNVMAKIGDKIEFNTNYNTEATFDFENKLKLKFEGKEDDIVKLIEAGDVTLPLSSRLITGSQSLFGIKTQLQFGRTTVTSVFSQQKSETKSITVQGGAQTTEFEIKALDYEDNRHFFLAHYFRDRYEKALENLPIVSSNINITKIEVWVTNRGPAVTENRNLVALMDLGEYNPYKVQLTPSPEYISPDNRSNNLFEHLSDTTSLRDINAVTNYLNTHPLELVSGRDFEKVENARKLNSNEFTLNSKLGFISLNYQLNPDQVLAVAYQYTIVGQDNKVYKVGEFSDDGITAPKALMVKLLRSTAIDTRIPMWHLMMKNVYNLNSYRINSQDFFLNILYSGGVNSVPTGYLLEGPEDVKGVPLIRVMGFDRLGQQLNPPPDGMFDFIDGAASHGGTIQSSTGRIYFPVLEPFGSYLRNKLVTNELGEKYAFDSLYMLTKTGAEQYPDKNKFIIEGMYKSESGSEISLNAINVPQGSVKVTAGGSPLIENVHYTVDYSLGRVRIIDEGILNSGTPINISLESTNMFNIQTKTLFGTRIEHEFNKNFYIGGTFLNLHERPLTQKVSYGNDPISNTIWGVDFGYQTDADFITRLIDKLPFYSTTAPSRITIDGEFAHFIPGHSKAVGKTGTTYIDDFEGSKSTIDLKTVGHWSLASTPQYQTQSYMFPEAAPGTGLKYGFNRARLAWYIIDPLFYEKTSTLRPRNVDKEELSRHSVRPVRETEVFPNIDPPTGQPMYMPVFNMSFYPSMRGPYNYDVRPTPVSYGINPDGSLREPQTRWGGMMRALDNTDFEATNIEYIEFWLMDPFAEDSLHSGGYLYFNLGDISEDLLRDGRKSFENGLPAGPEVINVDTTIWGRVPTIQALVNAFDNDPNSRHYQDVGYDGLTDEDERSFFQTYLESIAEVYGHNSEAYQQAYEDPSSDNFQYFRGRNLDDDERYSSISKRYQLFSNPDKNSPVAQQSPESYPTQATNLPNTEDINNDNTLNEAERYYQYKIELRPDKMQIGSNYIADIHHAQNIPLENGTRGNVKWYQFKVPVRSPDDVIGNIQDFRSIRFLRTYLKGWDQEVVLRFATLELVRSEWRRYYNELFEPGDLLPVQTDTRFEISTVNIEANGYRSPVPYVLPPGIEREINLGTINLQQKNEQSMSIKICDLADGDARGVYKTTDFDFRQFSKLKMFVHAEKSIEQDELKTGDLTAFIRIGSDFTQNYYEFEIPLEFTPWYTSSENNREIWPLNNEFDIDLEKLVEAKRKRNEAMNSQGSLITINTPFYIKESDKDWKWRITVMGSPSLSDVKALMLGVRNPKKRSFEDDDDGLPKCAEIWFNELRLTDFNDKSGWAATARVNTMLADIGNIMFSGSHSTPGFGALERRVSERQIESISQFDFATNIQLGKFFPENFGLRIPLHFDYSEMLSTPEYNPLDPDILYRDELKDLTSDEKQEFKKRTQDHTQRKNFNLMNVRKERGPGKTNFYPWDIENFDVSYAYSEINRSNIDIEFDKKLVYRGGIGYMYALNPKNIKPFANLTKIKLIKDFNFYIMPRSLSFRTDMLREYNARLLRNKSNALIKIDTNYIKKWDWSRLYDLKYDITQTLRMEFNAAANAFIDEPPGAVDRHMPNYPSIKDSIMKEIYALGTLTNYTQNLSVNYTLPINKITFLDWINVTGRYTSMFRWQASPRSVQESLGNTIENNGNLQFNGNLRFSNLYNKFGFLKKLNQPSRRITGRDAAPKKGSKDDEKEKAKDTITVAQKIGNVMKTTGNTVVRLMISLKDASLTYTDNRGTLLPGFMPEPTLLGNRLSDKAPGWGFVFGDQTDIRPAAVQNNWISTDTLLNSAYIQRISKHLSGRANLEPLPFLRIELTADRTEAINLQEYFKVGTDGNFASFAPQQGGNFSMSYLMWNTAFTGDRKDHTSPVFETFKENRIIVARNLAKRDGRSQGFDSIGFPDGYGATSSEVLLFSFLSTYSGRDPAKISLNPFPAIPLPNWRITYNGLSELPLMKKYFRTFTISHAYRSVYNVGSYLTNIEYNPNESNRDAAGNFIIEKRIDNITISEQFSPLFNIDATWTNSLLTRFEIRNTRNLSLSFVNNQLTEVKSKEYVLGLGYRIKDLKFIVINIGGSGSRQRMNSELNLKLDISMRNNKTVLRRIDEDVDQVSVGQRIMSINFSADYMVSQNLTARAFFERSATNPFISNQYPNSTTFAGLSLKFTLMQ